MKELYDIIDKVILSEKSLKLRETENIYIFNVKKDVNKIEIKAAVEFFFNVKVESIRTNIVRGKYRRVGKHIGKLSNLKKAYVKLMKGQKISALEA